MDALRVEYTLLRNISHPNILQVYDILEDDLNVYFVMVRKACTASLGPYQYRNLHLVDALSTKLGATGPSKSENLR